MERQHVKRPAHRAGGDVAAQVASRLQMFWRRKKKDAISAWQAETQTTQTTEIVVGEPSTTIATGVTVNSETFDPSNPEHREILEGAEAATGMDLDGDGTVAERPPGAAPYSVSHASDDPISHLERLQRLRESGALTEGEFAEQKRRVLGTD
jgi:hypothetical protein